jgi:hypothetical protein
MQRHECNKYNYPCTNDSLKFLFPCENQGVTDRLPNCMMHVPVWTCATHNPEGAACIICCFQSSSRRGGTKLLNCAGASGKETRVDEDITSMDTTSPIRWSWSWSSTYFQTAGKQLLATVVTASYGFQFGSSTTPWKDHQVYFQTDLASGGYLIRVGHNHWFYTEYVPICFY